MYFKGENFAIYHGDNRQILPTLAENSVDAIVTDPPYELGFMGKSWDASGVAFDPATWREALRVLKPGGHLIAFSGSRTYHRMAVAIEDAGFEIRDQIMWIYGSGFPKSHNISKGIDKKPETLSTIDFKNWLGEQLKKSNKTRTQIDEECGFTACSYAKTDGKDYWSSNHPTLEKWKTMKNVIGLSDEWDWIIPNNIEARGYIEATGGLAGGSGNTVGNFTGKQLSDNSISPAAKQWDGWGTALKPAHEPMVLARKPLVGTVAANVLTYGTGGLNIDGSRVGSETVVTTNGKGFAGSFEGGENDNGGATYQGRWPANVIHDGSDEVVALFPDTNKGTARTGRVGGQNGLYENGHDPDHIGTWYGDSGSAARFFYCAKASKRDRNEGLDGFEIKELRGGGGRVAAGYDESTQDLKEAARKYGAVKTAKANHHPTVKPTDLMRYLCRLITPPNGTVLDPFMGSGSTGKAAMYEGFKFIGVEMTDEYLPIAKARIEFAVSDNEGFLL